MQGTVKWFNSDKATDSSGPQRDRDVFVHITAVERAGLSTLNEGQAVEYMGTARGRQFARTDQGNCHEGSGNGAG